MCEEVQQVAPGQDAEDLAGLRHEYGRGSLELLERVVDRRVPLDDGDRRRHDRGDVGLQRVRVAEHPLEQLTVTDRSDELRDVGRSLADDRRLRDAVRLQHVDGLAHLVMREDGDHGGQLAALDAEHLLDPDHLRSLEEAVLTHPRI